jgi:glycosyltransferase involved in cell wall biosynthesis
MPKLSIILPYMEADEGKRQVLKETLDTCYGYDELIIVSNWKQGYAKPINQGLKLSTGDFMLVMNDDLEWDGGSLKRLCDPKAVVSPVVNGKEDQNFWGCSFCLPRWVYEKVGGMFEGYEISYWDDHDYQKMLEKEDIPLRCNLDVRVKTEGGRTLHTFPDHDAFYKRNMKIYQNRWA